MYLLRRLCRAVAEGRGGGDTNTPPMAQLRGRASLLSTACLNPPHYTTHWSVDNRPSGMCSYQPYLERTVILYKKWFLLHLFVERRPTSSALIGCCSGRSQIFQMALEAPKGGQPFYLLYQIKWEVKHAPGTMFCTQVTYWALNVRCTTVATCLLGTGMGNEPASAVTLAQR